jgi:probable rRNA maturation factor
MRHNPPASRIHVQVASRYADRVKPSQLKAAARAVLAQQGMTERVELTIVITGNAPIRKLNRQFRHIDRPTDVLSFNADEEPSTGRVARYLGDVIISYPTARAQATAGHHPVEAELQLLVVHGVLHLLGHDHAACAEKAIMWQAQRETLLRMGAAITEPKD